MEEMTDKSKLNWAACCDRSGLLFVVAAGSRYSPSRKIILSDHQGNPLVFSHESGVYVLSVIGSRGATFTGITQCHEIQSIYSLRLKIGSTVMTISEDDIDEFTFLGDLEEMAERFFYARPECRYINLRVKAQRVKGITVAENFGLETLRDGERQTSWMHKPFEFDTRKETFQATALSLAYGTDERCQQSPFEAADDIFWVGSVGCTNFVPVQEYTVLYQGHVSLTVPAPDNNDDPADQMVGLARRFSLENSTPHLWDVIAQEYVFDSIFRNDMFEVDKKSDKAVISKTCCWDSNSDYTFGLAIPQDASQMQQWHNLVQNDWKDVSGVMYNFLEENRSRLAFPWAVYETKKGDSNVLHQAALSAEICLRMLNDLALEPGLPSDPRPYQTPTSDCFQVFAFTSDGPMWTVYVCSRIKNVRHCTFSGIPLAYEMTRIWEGTIMDQHNAWTLRSMVKQICDWAGTEHKNFVCNHLYKWNKYYESNAPHQKLVHDPLVENLAIHEMRIDDPSTEITESADEKRGANDDQEMLEASAMNLKRLRGQPHPWWGMNPLYRPNSSPTGS